MHLRSNKDLYRYVEQMVIIIEKSGHETLKSKLVTALASASALSTEFLGECRIALRSVQDLGSSTMSEAEKLDLADVLKQIDDAFDNRTGRR